MMLEKDGRLSGVLEDGYLPGLSPVSQLRRPL
jgi:hypothetical protein